MAAANQTSQGGWLEHSISYATDKQRRIVKVCCGKKITDFCLGIEVVYRGAQRQKEFRCASECRLWTE
jgi:hypothetical protein